MDGSHRSIGDGLGWRAWLAFGVLDAALGHDQPGHPHGRAGMPPCLFGGTRLALAGAVLLALCRGRGARLRVARRDLGTLAATGLLLFVGGNGLITLALMTVDSGRRRWSSPRCRCGSPSSSGPSPAASG